MVNFIRANLKRVIGTAIALFLIAAMFFTEMFFVGGYNGSGTQSDPYQISDCSDLQNIGNQGDYSQHFIVVNDIDCSNFGNFDPIGGTHHSNHDVFDGTFDGQHHTIKGLTISGDMARMGLFREVQAHGRVENLRLSDVDIDNQDNYDKTGAIAGKSEGVFKDVHVEGTVQSDGNKVGGIVG